MPIKLRCTIESLSTIVAGSCCCLWCSAGGAPGGAGALPQVCTLDTRVSLIMTFSQWRLYTLTTVVYGCIHSFGKCTNHNYSAISLSPQAISVFNGEKLNNPVLGRTISSYYLIFHPHTEEDHTHVFGSLLSILPLRLEPSKFLCGPLGP